MAIDEGKGINDLSVVVVLGNGAVMVGGRVWIGMRVGRSEREAGREVMRVERVLGDGIGTDGRGGIGG